MKNKKVYVGLSGGVDSAVSAALLKAQGYEVVGVFITIAIPGYPCPAAEDRLSAMRVAAHLDIPFLEVDLSKEYEREVFKPSIAEWQKGKTPNPDTLCNEKIKFGIFFDWCLSQGTDFVATGHYARLNTSLRSGEINTSPTPARREDVSHIELRVAADQNKDQTYFLWAVPEAKLGNTLFPIGGLQKSEVRARAEKLGLPNSARPDSQGLCFLGDISLEAMLERETELVAGEVLDEAGVVVGRHKGAVRYTLGQRHGFELTATSSSTVPHFVVAKDVGHNTVTVSPNRYPQGKTKTIVELHDTNWIGGVESGLCMARFRYRQTLIPAHYDTATNRVVLQEPCFVPEGQSLVLYRGERCLGGGVISSVTLE